SGVDRTRVPGARPVRNTAVSAGDCRHRPWPEAKRRAGEPMAHPRGCRRGTVLQRCRVRERSPTAIVREDVQEPIWRPDNQAVLERLDETTRATRRVDGPAE